jgi:hypothetical protein
MASDRYAEYLPAILDWIQRTIATHAGEKRAVATFHFPRLPHYFSKNLLDAASVVITDHVPRPPLSALGLLAFTSFERQTMAGIAYLDTYFLEPGAATDESVHFHELVHLIQWQILGPKDFLLIYAAGLTERGYLECPIEAIASEHQRRFEVDWPGYSVESEVRKQTLALLNN